MPETDPITLEALEERYDVTLRSPDDLGPEWPDLVLTLARELEQAIRVAVLVEGENARYVEALRGATARVFDERRLILPMRLERDSLDAEVRRLRRAVEDAERRVIDLEEIVERLEEPEEETEGTEDGPVCGYPDPLGRMRCGRAPGHRGAHADPEIVGALWFDAREEARP